MCLCHIIILIVIFYLFFFKRGDGISPLLKKKREPFLVSRYDNRDYKVLKLNDAHIAADKLANINIKNQALIDYMIKNTKPGTHENILAERLKKNYRPNRLIENDPPDKENTSYTEDKGDTIALCLREKITGGNTLHDQNILEFVNLHELAHVVSIGYGHDDEFWSNFKILLKIAKEANIHIPKNYEHSPINYCGLDVNYNPHFDNTI